MRPFSTSRLPRLAAAPALAVAVLMALAGSGRAQDAGTVAALAGTVEIGRNGTWAVTTVGAAVQVGDTLRTGRPGRLQVVFRDDSVLNLADETELVIKGQTFEPERGILRSLIHVARGKMKAVASEYYSRPTARRTASYEVETVTAVAGVRGTEFVIVFDPVAEVTSVVGVTGTAEVHSLLDRLHHGVFVSSHDLTTVARGRLPSPPAPLTQTIFRQYLDGLDFIGTAVDSLTLGQAVLSGDSVAPSDVAAAFEAPPAPAAAAPMLGSSQFDSHGADVVDIPVIAPNVGAIDQPPAVLQQIQSNQGELGVGY